MLCFRSAALLLPLTLSQTWENPESHMYTAEMVELVSARSTKGVGSRLRGTSQRVPNFRANSNLSYSY